MNKKVSIITPCFNGAFFVHRYLNSVLNQTYRNIELIFIDDGSIDKTAEIVKSFTEKFKKNGMELIYIYQNNSGQAAALNVGLKIFKGEYLTWPDSDDLLTEDSIEKKVKFLEQNQSYGLVRTDGIIARENDIDNVIRYFTNNNPNKFKEDLFFDFIIENKVWFAPGCYMVRRSAFLDVNPSKKIYESKGGQNWQMLLPLTYKYKCGYIDEPLYKYVIRKNSHSHSVNTFEDEIKRCDVHEDILLNTIKNINMNKEEREYYENIIKQKYIRKKNQIALKYQKK